MSPYAQPLNEDELLEHFVNEAQTVDREFENPWHMLLTLDYFKLWGWEEEIGRVEDKYLRLMLSHDEKQLPRTELYQEREQALQDEFIKLVTDNKTQVEVISEEN